MNIRTFLVTGSILFMRLVLHLLLWWTLILVLAWSTQQLLLTHYHLGDTIDPNFEILVQDKHGIYTTRLKSWQTNQTLVRDNYLCQYQQDGDECSADSIKFKLIAPNTFQLYADHDTSISTQVYRITPENHVIPVSFKTWNIGMGMIVFVLSFPLFALLKGLFLRYVWNRKKQPVP